jgi:alkylhydroperoxidase family enzyme
MSLRAPATVLLLTATAVLGAWAGRRWLGPRPPQPIESAPLASAPSLELVRVPVAAPREREFEPTAPGALGAALRAAPPPAGQQLNELGIAALEAGELSQAVERFEAALAADGSDPVLAHNLAEALARRAVAARRERWPCEECLRDLARAAELDPQREELARLLARWRAEADLERDFWRERSQHFELAYDGSRDELVWGSGEILAELEASYAELGFAFARGPADPRPGARARPVSVVLYRREQFGSLTGLAEWAGGAYDGTIRVPIEDLKLERSSLRRTLRHELVHAFVEHLGGGKVPGWLNEGLAQRLEWDSKRERERAVTAARAELLGQENWLALSDLTGTLAQLGDERAVRFAYAQALVLVDYLARAFGEDFPGRLVAGESFEKAVGYSLEQALLDLRQELQLSRRR